MNSSDATPDIRPLSKSGRSTGSQLKRPYHLPKAYFSGLDTGSLHTVAGTAAIKQPDIPVGTVQAFQRSLLIREEPQFEIVV